MKNTLTILFIPIVLISCVSKNQHALKLDPRYNNIKTIHTIADCRGPKGTYTTETRTETGYFFFFQRFTYRDEPYTAVIEAIRAVELDSMGIVRDTLSAEVADAIGSHNFHWIAARPQDYYDSIQFTGEEEVNGVVIEKYEARNKVHQTVTILYDPAQQRITQILMGNPMDPNEQIKVTFVEWKDTEFGKQPARIEILQGTSASYVFNFVTVEINDPAFSKTNPKAI